MRVALLAPVPRHFYNQGSESLDHSATWIVLLVDALLQCGIETHVLTLGSAEINRWKSMVVSRPMGKVTIWTVETRKHGKMITDHLWERRMFHSCLNQIAPDVVHGNGTETLYSRCAVESGFPHVISLQTIMRWLAQVRKTDLFSWYAAFHERNTVRQARSVIIKSEFSRGIMRRSLAHKPVYLVRNPVHPAFLAMAEQGEPREKFCVFVGSIRKDKGIFDLIRAMAQPLVSHVYLKICGYGSSQDEARLDRLIKRYGLQNRIERLGQLKNEQLARVVSRAGVLVLPTYCDNTPNVVYEAIAAGTPVIATYVGGIPEMVEEGKTGRLFQAGDVDALVRLISIPPDQLVKSSLSERMEIARDLSRLQSPEAVAAMTINIYRQVSAQND